MTVVVAAMAIGLFSLVAYGAERAATNAVTVDAVEKGIVGMWNGVWTEPNMQVSYVLSFDAEGRITEEGFVGPGGMLLGSDTPRQGKIKYRIEANKDGAEVVIVRIDEKGTESPTYIVDQIDEKILKMRSIDTQTKNPKEPVSWERISAEPKKVKSEKQSEKKAE